MNKTRKSFSANLDDGGNVNMSVSLRSFNDRAVKCVITQYGGVENLEFVGVARCNFSEGDTFNQKKGEKIALKKALAKRRIYLEKRIKEYVEELNRIVLRGEKLFWNKLEKEHKK